jgi:diacylglycerol kinase (ATP)
LPTAAFVVNRNRIRHLASLNRRSAQAAAARGWQVTLVETWSADAGSDATRAAVEAGAGLVVAVGGDGTVRTCAQALAGGAVPLAIVPRGTANLVATALGVPSSLTAAMEVAFGPHQRRIDLAVADGVTFAAMAGIGLDAAVVGATASGLKGVTGWLGYAATGVRRLAGPSVEFGICLDGGEPLARRARSVVVGNVGLLPGGFVLLPEARPDDGRLDVGILAPAGPFGWPRVGWRVLTRSRRGDRLLERFQARRIEIAAGAPLPRQADGELIGASGSLTVTLAPGGLLVRVPAQRLRSGRPAAESAARRPRPRRGLRHASGPPCTSPSSGTPAAPARPRAARSAWPVPRAGRPGSGRAGRGRCPAAATPPGPAGRSGRRCGRVVRR